MASTGSTSDFLLRWMPAGAIFQHELDGLWTSWLVRSWLAATAVLTLLIVSTNWGTTQTAPMLQAVLFPYLVLPWFLVAMVLGISPVTGSRLDSLSDGILSRPITRYEYLLASWAARVVTVLAVYLAVIVPVVLLAMFAKRNVAEDQVTTYGLLATLTVVGLIQTFLVTLGFLMGTLLRRPMLAAVVLVLTWLPVNSVLSIFDLAQFSAFSMCQAVPTLLRTPWSAGEDDKRRSRRGKTPRRSRRRPSNSCVFFRANHRRRRHHRNRTAFSSRVSSRICRFLGFSPATVCLPSGRCCCRWSCSTDVICDGEVFPVFRLFWFHRSDRNPANGVGSRFRATINHMAEVCLAENDSRPLPASTR
jgi:hypothetical protein